MVRAEIPRFAQDDKQGAQDDGERVQDGNEGGQDSRERGLRMTEGLWGADIALLYASNYGQASSVTSSSTANLSLYLPVFMAESVSSSLS